MTEGDDAPARCPSCGARVHVDGTPLVKIEVAHVVVERRAHHGYRIVKQPSTLWLCGGCAAGRIVASFMRSLAGRGG